MSELAHSKKLYQATCDSNSEPYALQNIGDMMSPDFSENCIIIVDPSMQIHPEAFVVVDFKDELYFRQYIEKGNKKILRCLNSGYKDIELGNIFKVRGCVVQQKQRKQKSLHYYLPNKITGELEFYINGKVKPANS
jgi:SOS-response transcriptional repressor LexA